MQITSFDFSFVEDLGVEVDAAADKGECPMEIPADGEAKQNKNKTKCKICQK